MLRFRLIASFVFVLLFGVTTAFGAEFTADQVMTASGKTMTGKIAFATDRWRMETSASEGAHPITIGRMDKKVMWMIMPDQKMYMEMPLRPEKAPKTGEKLDNEVSRKKVGSETIDGHPCDKYEVTVTSHGRTDRMLQWIATDIHFPIKTASGDGKMVTEYKNIKMGRPADSLFEVPQGYTRMGMPGPMGGMPEGMTHQMPKGMPEMPGK